MKKIFTIFLIFAFINLWFSPYKVCCEKIIAQNQATPENVLSPESQVIAAGSLAAGETIAAFTLAEVLIAMTVIGVVAVLVIPPLVTNLRNAQLKTAWKENFSVLNQAAIHVMQDNGGTMVGAFNDNNSLKNVFKNHLNYITDKNQSGNVNDASPCWHSAYNWFYMDGVSPFTYGGNAACIGLNNGAFLNIGYYDNQCNNTAIYGAKTCGTIIVDVNGFKGPNNFGRDIFSVTLRADGIKPVGSYDDNRKGNCYPCIGCGPACSADYLMQ